MPKASRNAKDVESVKMQIIEAAKMIICRDGFSQLSMRKLAAVLGMTATNIYNYFSDKDEIYLGIQTAGFSMLLTRFQKVEQELESPSKVLEAFIKVYLDFGMNNPDYYEVMLGGNTPKYTDYVGTDLEKVALAEKQTALALVQMTTKVIMNISGLPKDDAQFRAVQSWAMLHGVVSLHNNRILQEMEGDLSDTITRVSKELLLPLNIRH